MSRRTTRDLVTEALLTIQVVRLEQLMILKSTLPKGKQDKVNRLIKEINDKISKEFNVKLNDNY